MGLSVKADFQVSVAVLADQVPGPGPTTGSTVSLGHRHLLVVTVCGGSSEEPHTMAAGLWHLGIEALAFGQEWGPACALLSMQ